MTKNKIDVGVCKTIDVAHTKPSKFNVREEPEDKDSDSFIELCDSIRANGLIEPIIVRSDGNSGFEAIAGSRRLQAMKHLGISEAPAVVRRDMDDNDVRIASLVENIHRRNLSEEDRNQAIFNVYKAEDFTNIQQVVTWLGYARHHSEELDQQNKRFGNSIAKSSTKGRGEKPPDKFMDLAYRIGYAFGTQENYLRDLDEFKSVHVRKAVKRSGIKKDKKDLLKHPSLAAFPKIQEVLAMQIRNLSYRKAKNQINQVIHDLSTGAIRVDKYGNIIEDKTKQETIESEDEVKTETSAPVIDREEIIEHAEKMFELISGKKHSGIEADAQEIAKSKDATDNMKTLAKLMIGPRELGALQTYVNPLSTLLTKFVKILYEAAEDQDKKDDLLTP